MNAVVQVAAGVVLVGTAAFVVSRAYAASSATPALEASPCAPYEYDERLVDERIRAYLDTGTSDPALVAVNTATEFFGTYPGGGSATFPPPPNARPGISCVFGRVLAQVDAALRGRGLTGHELTNPSSGVVWSMVSLVSGSPDLARYPFERPVIGRRAIPSTFVQIEEGDDGQAFFRDATANALELAGMPVEIAYDPNSKIGKRLRREMRDVILAAPFNDLRVTSCRAGLAGGRDPGTNGADDPGLLHPLGPQGRGLVWVSCHFDDAARLAVGLPAKRGIDLDGRVIGSGRSPMLVYVPAVSLAELRGATPRITCDGMAWSNGKSTLSCPPDVERLGIDQSGVAVESAEKENV